MKSVAQLLSKYSEQTDAITDEVHFHKKSLLQFVPFKMAYPHVDYGPTPAEWGEYYRRLTSENVILTIKEYMPYAWARVIERQVLPCRKVIAKFRVWLWILEDITLNAFIDNAKNFDCCGAPILKRICGRYHWNWRKFVSGTKIGMAERLIKGEKC